MNKEDLMELELKSIMEEDTRNLDLSQESIDRILKTSSLSYKRKGFIYRVKDFLNKEIEIPLAPVLLGLLAFFLLASLPKDIVRYEGKKVIEMGNNQVIISSREVGKK